MTARAKVVSVLGARPQFIKAASVTPAFRRAGLQEVIIHTGQHYDWEMSASFFDGFKLPLPDHCLGIGSASHAVQTGKMLEAVEKVLVVEHPDMVIVYGDTNSTLAGALAAVKLHIPIAHVEAGLRSFDKSMPEEVNRIIADHVSSVLFAPTAKAVENLRDEGIKKNVCRTGDVMYDLFLASRGKIKKCTAVILDKYGLRAGGYALATVHRAENTDNLDRWTSILAAFKRLTSEGIPVIWPAHPRTKGLLMSGSPEGVLLVPPLPYLETQALIGSARVVLTDSGGLQKEAAFHGVPCIVLRDKTEWIELVEQGFAVLAGTDQRKIVKAALSIQRPKRSSIEKIFGKGNSSQRIAEVIQKNILNNRNAKS